MTLLLLMRSILTPAHTLTNNGILVLSALGNVEAEIDVRVALIDGLVRGRITASELVVLGSHAKVVGEVKTPSLAINCGAVLEGTCLAVPPRKLEANERCSEKPKMRAVGA